MARILSISTSFAVDAELDKNVSVCHNVTNAFQEKFGKASNLKKSFAPHLKLRVCMDDFKTSIEFLNNNYVWDRIKDQARYELIRRYLRKIIDLAQSALHQNAKSYGKLIHVIANCNNELGHSRLRKKNCQSPASSMQKGCLAC